MCLLCPVVVESLEKRRQPLPHLEAVYIVVPNDGVSVGWCGHVGGVSLIKASLDYILVGGGGGGEGTPE